jgi:hypothetical protein
MVLTLLDVAHKRAKIDPENGGFTEHSPFSDSFPTENKSGLVPDIGPVIAQRGQRCPLSETTRLVHITQFAMHLIYNTTLKVLCLALLLPIAAVANLDFIPVTLIQVNTSQPLPDSLGRRHPSQYLYKRSLCCTSDEASCCQTSGQTCCSFDGGSILSLVGQSYDLFSFFLGKDC